MLRKVLYTFVALATFAAIAGAQVINAPFQTTVGGCVYNTATQSALVLQGFFLQCDSLGNLKTTTGTISSPSFISVVGTQVVPVSKSGTITAGTSAQTLMAANTARRGCEVQNVSSADLWIYELGTATASQPSKWMPAGSYYICPPTGIPTSAWSIIGGTTGQAFMAREW